MKKKALILTFLTVASSALTGVGFSSFIIAFQGMPDAIDVPLQNQLNVGETVDSSLYFLKFNNASIEGVPCALKHGAYYDSSIATASDGYAFSNLLTTGINNIEFTLDYDYWKPILFNALEVKCTITFPENLTGLTINSASYVIQNSQNPSCVSESHGIDEKTTNNNVISCTFAIWLVNDSGGKIEPFEPVSAGPFNLNLSFNLINSIKTDSFTQPGQPTVSFELTAIKQ